MSGPTLWLPRPDTAQRRRQAAAGQGRPKGRLPGEWLWDLSALGKSIALCDQCDAKWSPRQYGYVVWRRDYLVRDACDRCRQGAICKLFVPEAVVEAVGQVPRRRAGRWGTFLGWLPQKYRDDTR